jgi:hypothetical protein
MNVDAAHPHSDHLRESPGDFCLDVTGDFLDIYVSI